MIDFLDSEYGGARVIYMWGNMVEGAVGEKMLARPFGIRFLVTLHESRYATYHRPISARHDSTLMGPVVVPG